MIKGLPVEALVRINSEINQEANIGLQSMKVISATTCFVCGILKTSRGLAGVGLVQQNPCLACAGP